MGTVEMLGKLKYLGYRVIEPLLADDEIEHFTLAIPEAATTTYRRSTGWSNRPGATVQCPDCGADFYQHRSSSDLDCPNCHRSSSADEFGRFEVLSMHCPRCGEEMDHGRRHPMAFDVPQWATCGRCQFHWEYSHDY